MTDSRHMWRAIELAAKERPHPNPRVGAVVVSADGRVVGEGAHQRRGTPHAESYALDAAGAEAVGATIYVTLEPCNFTSLTPPCVQAILEAGIAKAIVAIQDPDTRVSGNGIAALRHAGVDVETGLLSAEVEAMDPGYFHHRRTGLPRVTLKMAATLDGASAANDGSSQWITGVEARNDSHRLRFESDAVLVGAGTLRADDPELTARYGHEGFQPRPVILAGNEVLPVDRQLWLREPLVVSTRLVELPAGDQVIVGGDRGRPDPVEAAKALAAAGYLDVLLEGGPRIAGAWWKAGVVTRGILYFGAKLAGGRGINPLSGEFTTLDMATDITIGNVSRLGGDLKVEFR